MIKRILIILISIAIVVVVFRSGAVPQEALTILEDLWNRVNDWLESVAGISFREIIISIVDIFIAIFEAFIDVIRWLVEKL